MASKELKNNINNYLDKAISNKTNVASFKNQLINSDIKSKMMEKLNQAAADIVFKKQENQS